MVFTSALEKKAAEAVSLEAFDKLNLHGIKNEVAELLGFIGRDGIFRDYTKHDIGHIDSLLEILEWLIPAETLSQMTASDCLLTTLAVYFHDLGMLVTKDEFAGRGTSSFADFTKDAFTGDHGKDYRDRVAKMPADETERFLYQEFVREHHAERIRAWIAGSNRPELGASDQVAVEVAKILSPFNIRFRKDLGLVCESHHRDDLDDLDKYKVSQSYGPGRQATANLQYAAILLRSADLLHITRDRAPSISFRLINPSDPKSIQEWNKQMPVISVQPKPSEDAEGNVDKALPMDTISVSGTFDDPDGFFSLIAYLGYSAKEVRKCNQWSEVAKKKRGATYAFPWRNIDTSGLEAEGFVNKQFEFILDQGKILDLLTGQTLYNDTTVVLRELVQNSLDAIRVQWEAKTGFIAEAEVVIAWNSAARVLTIRDNGTGMSQKIIDNHFLKVGSSFYQDEEFRKAHPHFSPISRFGIGALSTFMVSDDIEVTTCHPDDEQARRLSLRSLHGKYLVRLLDKSAPELAQICPHGTEIALKVRPSAELRDVAAILRRWIIFPRCNVSVTVDNGAPARIGFAEPEEALMEAVGRIFPSRVSKAGAPPRNYDVSVRQRTNDGVTLAYAVQWSDAFQEWNFLPIQPNRDPKEMLPTGSCVEGIRVDSGSPGYLDTNLLSLANATGKSAPKTNVARSAFEETPEQANLLKKIYGLYCDHVKGEVVRMQQDAGFSLTWAVGEATWLLDSLVPSVFRPLGRPIDSDALSEACADVPSLTLESDGKRTGVSPKELSELKRFWTVESIFFTSAETLLREIPSSVAISSLAEPIGKDTLQMPPGPYISIPRQRSVTQRLAFHRREVTQIVVRRDQRRVDLEWGNLSDPPLWRTALPEDTENLRLLNQLLATVGSHLSQSMPEVYIARRPVSTTGLNEEISIASLGKILVLPESRYCQYLNATLERIDTDGRPVDMASYVIALTLVTHQGVIPSPAEYVKQQLALMGRQLGHTLAGIKEDPELVDMLLKTEFKSFNPQSWIRNPQT